MVANFKQSRPGGGGGSQRFTTKYGPYKEDQYFDVWLRECNSDKFSDTLRVVEGFMGDVIKARDIDVFRWE